MRRVIVIAVAGASLAGCRARRFPGTTSSRRRRPMQVQLELDAAGRRCPDLVGTELQDPLLGQRTGARCRISRSPTRLNRFQPATVPVQVIHTPAISPTPPRRPSIPIRSSRNFSRPVRRRSGPDKLMHRPKKPKPPKGAAAPAAARRSPNPAPALRRPPRPSRAAPRQTDCSHCTDAVAIVHQHVLTVPEATCRRYGARAGSSKAG